MLKDFALTESEKKHGDQRFIASIHGCDEEFEENNIVECEVFLVQNP